MIQIDEPPGVKACAPCGSPLVWLYSPRRNGWVAFIPVDETTLRVHPCRPLQEPGTWRDLQRGTPPTGEYLAAREQLKTGNENGVDHG